jgi:hypothetical protein
MIMTDTLATLQAQLDTLNAARARGAKTISYTANGVQRSVEYKSDIEMNAAAQDLTRRIAALSGVSPYRTVLISSSKGLCDRGEYGRGGDGRWD